MLARVFVIPIKTDSEKKNRLVALVRHHFYQKEKMVLCARDEQAAHFFDDWFWRVPDESSFFPHAREKGAAIMPLLISLSKENLNQAAVFIDLSESTTTAHAQFPTIYELSDDKENRRSQGVRQRLELYRSLGCSVTEHP